MAQVVEGPPDTGDGAMDVFLVCGGHGCARKCASVARGSRSDLVRVPWRAWRKREEVGRGWGLQLGRG